MRYFELTPTFWLDVFGHWTEVISIREYRDALIDQKPYYDNADDAENDYSRYRVKCQTSKELVEAYQAFSGRGLECEISVSLKVPGIVTETLAEFFAATGTGYGKSEQFCDVMINHTEINAVLAGHVRRALEELNAIDS